MRQNAATGLMALFLSMPAAAMVGPATPAPELAGHVVMVLTHRSTGAGFCSGTLIAPTKVLTAAHCVGTASDMRVHYRDTTGNPVLLEIGKVAVHPDFHAQAPKTREKSIDLAVVTLKAPMPQPFAPAPLAPQENLNVGDTATLAGFGLTREGDARSAGTLLQGNVTLRAPYSDVLFWLTNADGLGACTGDSGGPVFQNGALIGVISWTEGVPPAHCGKLTQAIRLKSQMNWIRQQMAEP